jgi:hydroxymethylglutaryl-CoA reductase (NADPH)
MKGESITLKEELKANGVSLNFVTGKTEVSSETNFKGNIENFIGMAQIPIGLAGPIIVNGSKNKGDYSIPLATTEGALVASYSRGMKACNLSGGITSYCLRDVIQRSPFFKFDTLDRVQHFSIWIESQMYKFVEIVACTSRFAKLLNVSSNIEGNSIILTFDYTTGDAAGQNMVTICTHQICQYILENYDQKPSEWYIESNYSGDKKATALSFSNGRGKKVASEVTIKKSIVNEVLKSTPENIVAYWKSSTLAVVQSGAIGAQGHVANALTALFIACGQDVACIAESSTGITRMELTPEGDLYVAVTLPSLVVGTVGGGTGLPTQRECLEMMHCYGEGKAIKFAEICCAVALAGEISIAAAMSADHFAQAHKSLGRK